MTVSLNSGSQHSSENRIRSLVQGSDAVIMGIINATPDSFSDGGLYNDGDAGLKHALALVSEGADILDIGGESTRPGADQVSLQQELDRVIPIIERITQECNTPVSIDTYKPQVMRDALTAGASMVNDINGLRSEGAVKVVADAQVPVCLMHMIGEPKNMQKQPIYQNVVGQVIEFLQHRIQACVSGGIKAEDIIVDPGIGFGKTLEHNLKLLSSVRELREQSKCEVLIGVSRKSMIDAVLSRAVDQRIHASVGLAVQAALNGAKILRVHDVRATHDAIRCIEAVRSVQ